MPIGQGARNTIILGGLGRPQLFDTNVKATSIDEDIFTDQEVISAAQDADLVLVLDVSETPDQIKYITRENLFGSALVAISGNVNNRVTTATGAALLGEANLLFDGTILTNDGGEIDIDISSGDPHLSFQIGGTDEFTIGVDDSDSDIFKIDTGGTVGGATKLSIDTSGNVIIAGGLTMGSTSFVNSSGVVQVAAQTGITSLGTLTGLGLDGNKNIGPGDGSMIHLDTSTLTDNSTSSSGTAALFSSVRFEGPTLAASNSSVTTTAAATLYIDNAPSAGTNQTLSNAYALFVDAGNTRLDGDLVVGGDLTISGDDITMGTNTSGAVLVADGTNYNPVVISGDIAIATNGAATIADTAVEGDMLNDNIISGQSEISTVANDDVFLAIDTSGGGLKKIARSTIVAGLATSSAISNVADDSTPQLGGSLDVNGEDIISVSDGNITLTPNGTGVVRVDGAAGIDMQSGSISIKNAGSESYVRFYCESSNAHYTQLQAAPHSSYSGNVTVVLPASADTLVGRATTDTLTNKTFGDNVDIFEDANNADVTLRMGTSAAESLSIEVLNGGSNKTAEAIHFSTATASGTANHGKMVFDIDGTDQFEINDSGVVVTGDLTITGDDLLMNTNTAGHILVGDDTNYNPVAVSGDITLASNGAVTIAAGAVEHGMLADDIVSGQAEITSGFAAADELMYSDGGTIKRVGLDTLATKLFSVASAGTVAQASDHMVLLDGGATGDVIIESIDDFLTAIAGANISVSSSQLAVASASATAADDIAEGDGAVNLVTTSGNITIDAQANDADVIIKVDDAGSAVTAVTFDGSDEGNAIFVNDIQLKSDAALIEFGADLDTTITHVADTGLTITNTIADTDNKPIILQLKSEEDAIVAADVIGSIEIAAGDSDGTDGATVAAGIHAIAEDTFSGSANPTKLVFTTGVSETAASGATAKMTLSSAGLLTIADDFMLKDGGTIGVASAATALTIASSGIVTFVDDIIIKDAGTIGSASDTNAIGISSGGVVSITATTANTDATDGALTVAGGASIAADLTVGDDLRLLSDSAIISLGEGSDATLTHDGTTGLTIAANPFEVDSGGNITLDAHTGIFIFQDANTEMLRITESGSGDMTIKLETDGKDLIFTDNNNDEGFRILDGAAGVKVAGTIDLGHASDTTIARSGSGAITVEGTQVLLAGAQTGITTILNAGTKIGRDSQNLIDFATTDNKIIFRVNNVNEVELIADTLSPVTSDGVALGTGSLMWSDLFLASGSVVNFNNGDVTLTHSSETLTVGGGTLATAALTTSTIVASGIVKTDDGTDATSTTDGSLQTDGGLSVAKDGVIGNDLLLLSDAAVLKFGADSEATITHADDAGLTFNSTSTFADVVLADDKTITLADEGQLIFGDTVPSADHKATGVVVSMASGESVAAFNAVYIRSDGEVGPADADAVGSMPAIGVALEAKGDGEATKILIAGVLRDDTYNFTPGADLFVGTTAGAITATAPSGSGDTVQKIGVALSADSIYVNFNTTEVLLA